jgi:hypothetical protein
MSCAGVSHNIYVYDDVVRMIPCMIGLARFSLAHARNLHGVGFVSVEPRMQALLSPLSINSS